MKQKSDILIVGGGAAGFFTAINLAENNPNKKIIILERGKEVLNKVRISGGGRCNLTHAEFLPKALTQNYPRGEKELLGPFHQFMTGDTFQWFEKRGVELKIEEDGRVFPISDSSETIINCFLNETKRLGIQVLKNHAVKEIKKVENTWNLSTDKGIFSAQDLVLATGSNPKIWKLLAEFGHQIVSPVPSLFTFNIKDQRIENIPGIASHASVEIIGTKLKSEGPLLITHWGMSGPGILKLSAWGAVELNRLKYHFDIRVNWLPEFSPEVVLNKLKTLKQQQPKQQVLKRACFDLPKRLWQNLIRTALISETQTWADLNKNQLQAMTNELTQGTFQVTGKSTFKEEFVTAGGVELSEVNFKNFQSKFHKNLYFAGEILNIDAITGGFNFQNAWTGGFLIAKSIS